MLVNTIVEVVVMVDVAMMVIYFFSLFVLFVGVVIVGGGGVDDGNNCGVCFCTTGVITLKSLVGQGPHWLWTVMCDRHVCASPSWAVKLLHKT